MDIIIAVVGSGGLYTLIQMWLNHRWQKKEKQEKSDDAMRDMVLAIGRSELLRLCKACEHQGYIEDDDYEVLVGLGEPYLAMNGNAKVKKHYNTAKVLPIKDTGGKNETVK